MVIKIKEEVIRAIIGCFMLIYMLFIVYKKLIVNMGMWSLMDGVSGYNWNPFVGSYTLTLNFGSYFMHIFLLIPLGIFLRFKISSKYIYCGIGIFTAFALEILQPVFESGVSDILSIIILFIGYCFGGYIFTKALIVFKK